MSGHEEVIDSLLRGATAAGTDVDAHDFLEDGSSLSLSLVVAS